MENFTFSGSNDRPTPAAEKVLDGLIQAAGGAPLPGVLGVAQALATVWTDERSGPAWLRHGRNALLSAGIFRAYWKSKHPERGEERQDPIARAIAARGLGSESRLDELGQMLWKRLCASGHPHRDEKVGDAVFQHFDGNLSFFFYREEDVREVSGRSGYFQGMLLVRTAEKETAVTTAREVIWRGSQAGLDLVQNGTAWGGENLFSLVQLAPAGNYVDRPSDDGIGPLESLAQRCKRFRNAGISRRVLFHGPPGCGKSTLARTTAIRIADGRVLRMDPKAVSSASNNVMYRMIDLLEPTVVLLDDMDRASGANGLLSFLADEQGDTITVGTVNALGQLDPALLRPGRFDEVIEVGTPTPEWVAVIAAHYETVFGTRLPEGAAKAMEGLTPAEIREVIQVCAMIGVDLFEVEVERVRRQSELYSNDAVAQYLSRRDGNAALALKPGVS